jgi:hypothetical protein
MRYAAQQTGGVAASHRALSSTVLPIKAARTHARAISMGAVAVFCAFRRRKAPVPRVCHNAECQRRYHSCISH